MRSQTFRPRLSGTVGGVPFSGDHVVRGSFRLSCGISGGSAVEIGGAYLSRLTATFQDLPIGRYQWIGQEIRPRFGVVIPDGTSDDTVEWIPMGVYTIAEADESSSGASVTAYDALARLDRPCYPYHGGVTPASMVLSMAERCGVTFSQTTDQIRQLPNGTEKIFEAPDSGIETYRDRARYLARYLGCFLTADRDGTLVFRPYGRRIADTIDPARRDAGSRFADYVSRYTAVRVESADGTVSTYALTVDDGLVYDLGRDPFLALDSADTREKKARRILAALQAVRYVPFTSSGAYDPAYDLGDVLRFHGGIADGTALSCVTTVDFSFSGAWRMEGAGEDPRTARAKSAAEKAVDALRSSVSASSDLHVTRNDDAVATVSGASPVLLLDAGISASDGAQVRADAMIRFTAATPVGVLDNVILTARWRVDGAWAASKDAPQICFDGAHVLTLTEDHILSGSGNHAVQIWISSVGGTVSIAAGDAALYLSGGGVSAPLEDWEPEPDEPYLLYIEITTPPTKTEYDIGERINYAGMTITAYWSDGTTADVTADCHLTPADGAKLDTPGPVQVTALYYAGEEAHWAYTDLIVSEAEAPETPVILSIYVAQDPPYGHAPGTALDYYGVVIMATREDGADFDVTGECTYSPAEGTTWADGRAVVTVTLLDNGETYTTSFVVPEIGIEEEEDPAIDPGVTPGPADPDDPVGPWYDPARIVVQTDEETGDVSFALENPYTYTGTDQSIDEGACAVVEIPTDGVKRIESLTITGG